MNIQSAIALLVAVVCGPCAAFPDGAPIEACILGNKPNHYGTEPKPPFDSKVKFYASDSYYGPNSVIYVHIDGDYFKGFFVQARDAKTKKWIGTFEENRHLKSYPECSSVTHKDKERKEEVELVWHPPPNSHGEVFFTGTVLQNYAYYWSDLVAKAPRHGRHG